jgi:hypothetical protein
MIRCSENPTMTWQPLRATQAKRASPSRRLCVNCYSDSGAHGVDWAASRRLRKSFWTTPAAISRNCPSFSSRCRCCLRR